MWLGQETGQNRVNAKATTARRFRLTWSYRKLIFTGPFASN